jgi:general secretion pathway protein A
VYEQYYGLDRRPFELTPDPRFLYLTPQHIEALAHLEYALTGRKGITVLTGEAGTGKTTLLRAALERVRGADVMFAHLSNPTLIRDEFYQLLAAELGLSLAAGRSKAQFLMELNQLVHARFEAGGVVVLIIDEAQSLSFELLEEIRLLANIESDTEKLLQVILIGQPELAGRLNAPELRQLKQRIALRCRLTPLSLRETAAYIAGRLRIAGADAAHVFTREAVALIHERSHGIPRSISVICDNALVSGFALGIRPIDRQTVINVCRDLDFADAPMPLSPSPLEGAGRILSLSESAVTSSPESAPSPVSPSPPAASGRFSLFSTLLSGHRS